jgi:hypothetical protein
MPMAFGVVWFIWRSILMQMDDTAIGYDLMENLGAI